MKNFAINLSSLFNENFLKETKSLENLIRSSKPGNSTFTAAQETVFSINKLMNRAHEAFMPSELSEVAEQALFTKFPHLTTFEDTLLNSGFTNLARKSLINFCGKQEEALSSELIKFAGHLLVALNPEFKSTAAVLKPKEKPCVLTYTEENPSSGRASLAFSAQIQPVGGEEEPSEIKFTFEYPIQKATGTPQEVQNKTLCKILEATLLIEAPSLISHMGKSNFIDNSSGEIKLSPTFFADISNHLSQKHKSEEAETQQEQTGFFLPCCGIQ